MSVVVGVTPSVTRPSSISVSSLYREGFSSVPSRTPPHAFPNRGRLTPVSPRRLGVSPTPRPLTGPKGSFDGVVRRSIPVQKHTSTHRHTPSTYTYTYCVPSSRLSGTTYSLTSRGPGRSYRGGGGPGPGLRGGGSCELMGHLSRSPEGQRGRSGGDRGPLDSGSLTHTERTPERRRPLSMSGRCL